MVAGLQVTMLDLSFSEQIFERSFSEQVSA
jgi:hypothetical protein